MRGLDQIMKQAQKLQEQVQQTQDKIAHTEIHGNSGGGLVSVMIMGNGQARSIKIDKTLIDPSEIEVLEDLVVAAFNDARSRLENYSAEELGKVTQGLPLPGGLKMPF